MAAATLNVAHFNDVYQVSEQKIHVDGKVESIDATKFASLLADVTSKWDRRSDGTKDGLIVFSGDLFSPSIQTSVTRGRHMPPIINALEVEVACPGNHEFDLGVPRLKELINDTKFPWLLSNILDTNTGMVPETMQDVHVLEKKGVRIGFIGLVEKDWIPTITGWPKNFVYQDFVEVGKKLSAKLRDRAGEYKCDIVVAITHCRFSNDIKLARALRALSPTAQVMQDITSQQGVDLVLGGHDHEYWISKGVTGWEGYDLQTPNPDATDDQGDTLIVKSGTDFQDLSEITITLKDTPEGSLRRKVISEIRGKRIVTRGHTPINAEVKKILDRELGTINAALGEVILNTEVLLDARSSLVRVHESPIANWIVDCLRHTYDEALGQLGYPKADGCMMNCGSIRGDKVYEPGPFTLGDLMTILPYPDPLTVIEISATDLFGALESGLGHWPQQEGRFPAVSGFRVSWDSSKPPGQRVDRIWLLENCQQLGPNNQPILVDKEEVLRTSTRKYLLLVGEYMALGGDGYDDLANKKSIISAEGGQPRSALIRKLLLGSQLLNKQTAPHESISALQWLTSTPLITAALALAHHEDLGLIDCYERQRARIFGGDMTEVDIADEDAKANLPVIHPVVDGRLKDIADVA